MAKAQRFVEVRYKCRCMAAEAAVHVPERHASDEDVVEWVRVTMGTVIALDHRLRSPLCMATSMEYAKIHLEPDGFIGQGKGGTA